MLEMYYNVFMVKEFLEESNKIENVFDRDSLKQAVRAWEYVTSQKELTPEVILKTHGVLMRNQNLRTEEKGCFRRVGVKIGARYGLEWWLIKEAVKKWCEDTEKSKSKEEIKQNHIAFEIIHPFIDGNGRVGRILLNWQRIKNGLPILVIRNAEKYLYYAWF